MSSGGGGQQRVAWASHTINPHDRGRQEQQQQVDGSSQMVSGKRLQHRGLTTSTMSGSATAGRRPRQQTISGGLDISAQSQLQLEPQHQLLPQRHRSATAIDSFGTEAMSAPRTSLATTAVAIDYHTLVAPKPTDVYERLGAHYSSSQAQLQSLVSTSSSSSASSTTGELARKSSTKGKTTSSPTGQQQLYRSQLSLGPTKPLVTANQTPIQMMLAGHRPSASPAHPVGAQLPLPPPYNGAAGGSATLGLHQQPAICHQPTGGQRATSTTPSSDTLATSSNNSQQQASNHQPAGPISVPRLHSAPQVTSSSSSFPMFQQQQQQQLNFNTQTGGGSYSAAAFNQFPHYLQHQQLPSQVAGTNNETSCHPIHHQLQQHHLIHHQPHHHAHLPHPHQHPHHHPHHQHPSIVGVSVKSKSCLTCADISIKWYIVVIALLGLICALIGTIVGAVHSVGRDYISLALLLIGVGLVLVAISWVALRITIKAYRSGRAQRLARAAATSSARTAPGRSPHQRRPAPAVAHRLAGRLHAVAAPTSGSASLHRSALNERLYMVAAAAAALSRQPGASEQGPTGATTATGGLVDSIKRLARNIRGRIQTSQQEPPGQDQQQPAAAAAAAALAALLHHYHHQQAAFPHFGGPPPAHLFAGFPTGDAPIRPPPPSYSASMQDQRFRQLMQERAGIQAAAAAVAASVPQPRPPPPPAQPDQPANQQQQRRPQAENKPRASFRSLRPSSSSPALAAPANAASDSAQQTTSVISIQSRASLTPQSSSSSPPPPPPEQGRAKMLGTV